MDDYNINVLSEAKNEYSSRLVTILTPIIIEGIKSIYNEADQLCLDNEEDQKYLMTFQNFLTRVPKWNSNIIDEETERILKVSGCTYLEDLLTCVHITQLKILTSIRVSNVQKKIDIEIPKLSGFVHKIYIAFARKLYSNIYLFEKHIMPLQYQKNMRECEILVQECILNTIRDNMPVENILRAYMDETVNEEIIEEIIEKSIPQNEIEAMENNNTNNNNENENENLENNTVEITKTDKPVLVDTRETENEDWRPLPPKEEELENTNGKIKEMATATKINQQSREISEEEANIKLKVEEQKSRGSVLSFNDNDSVLDLGTNKESIVQAPKTDERLAKIAKEQHEKRKAEEAEEDDEEKLTIFDSVDLKLDSLDVNNLEKKLDTRPDPILNDIEILG